MNYWDSVGRWINTLLVFIVGVLAFDALFRLLDANDDNVLVGFVHQFAVIFLMPFQGMFGEQDFVLTTLVGVLGYSLLAGIALSVLRALQASAAQPARPVETEMTTVVDGPVAPPEALPPDTQPDASAPEDGSAHDAPSTEAPPAATPGGQPAERANGRPAGPTSPDGRRDRPTPTGEPPASDGEPERPGAQRAAPDGRRRRGGGPRERGRARERTSSGRGAARRADVTGRS